MELLREDHADQRRSSKLRIVVSRLIQSNIEDHLDSRKALMDCFSQDESYKRNVTDLLSFLVVSNHASQPSFDP